jgi:transcriptional regulator
MAAGRLEAMKKAIVGLVMTIEEIEGSFKLNQHKSDADYTALAHALASQSDADARAIAGLMREARPLAFVMEAIQNNQSTTPERSV